MKKLPESELELMMIIWQAGRAMTRPEIEAGLGEGRKLGATTILSFLSRLQEKGFLKVERRGTGISETGKRGNLQKAVSGLDPFLCGIAL